jgi:hypothetical protein
MNWVHEKHIYQDFARQRHPAAVLVPNDIWLGKVVAVLRVIFTFGFNSYRGFLDSTAVAFGPVQLYPGHLRSLSRQRIVHECNHTQWCEYFGWLVPIFGWFFGRTVRTWVGLPLFLVFYFLVPLPFVFAFCRWQLELEADKESYRWLVEVGAHPDLIRTRALSFGKTVCSSSYGWPWLRKFGGVRAFTSAAEKIINE